MTSDKHTVIRKNSAEVAMHLANASFNIDSTPNSTLSVLQLLQSMEVKDYQCNPMLGRQRFNDEAGCDGG